MEKNRSSPFTAFFLTQFFGALNDNLLKNALVIFIVYRAWSLYGLSGQALVSASAGLFVLPFVLCSAVAGQLADGLPPRRVIVWIKTAEVVITLLAAIGFWLGDVRLLLLALLGMGVHSAFFGPIKYSILPDLLPPERLVAGNAAVESGTFVAILLGTLAGGLVAGWKVGGSMAAGVAVIGVSLLGLVSSLRLPHLPPHDPGLAVKIHFVAPLVDTFRAAVGRRDLIVALIAISWFWFFGASVLTLLPSYTKDVLSGSEAVVTLFLVVFCVGIALGSLLCERVSRGQLEPRWVTVGALGMLAGLIWLEVIGDPYRPVGISVGGAVATSAVARRPDALVGIGAFLTAPGSLQVLASLTLVAVASGLFTVPLYSMFSLRGEARTRSRLIAANNVLNAFFMVASALLLMFLSRHEVAPPSIFGVIALLHATTYAALMVALPELWRGARTEPK